MRGIAAFVLAPLAALVLVHVIATTFEDPEPVPPADPQSLVWADRVFTNKAQFARWLDRRGSSYRAWVKNHPNGAPWERAAPERAGSGSDGGGIGAPAIVAALLALAGVMVAQTARRRRYTLPRLRRRGPPAVFARGRPAHVVPLPARRLAADARRRTLLPFPAPAASRPSYEPVVAPAPAPVAELPVRATLDPAPTLVERPAPPTPAAAPTAARGADVSAVASAALFEHGRASNGGAVEPDASNGGAVEPDASNGASVEPEARLVAKPLPPPPPAVAAPLDAVAVDASPAPHATADEPVARIARVPAVATDALCEIALWRGYLKGQFYAVASDAAATVVAASPMFRCRSDDPDETPSARDAHRTLVAALAADGWAPAAEGSSWWQGSFARG